MKLFVSFSFICFLVIACDVRDKGDPQEDWSISVIPSSIRLDPTTNKVIDYRFDAIETGLNKDADVLAKNWIYDGDRVTLHAARGEYVSFQLVITNHTATTLKYIQVEIPAFRKEGAEMVVKPELFLEWSVKVKTPSTGYPQASLGTGWYPDALIPFKHIQDDSTEVHRRWTYPLWIPDFNNRIEDQISSIVWVDQFIPFAREEAMPGTYSSVISVSIGERSLDIPIDLNIWDFAIPNENRLKASLQHEGFVSRKSEQDALEIYQLLKRNRIALMDPTYDPELKVSADGKIDIDWKAIDDELSKYFTGEAFTEKYGYMYGPGYGEPIETYVLPFDVYGKHGTSGWPDIGKPDVERNPENRAIYIQTIKEVREHLSSFIDPEKTDLTVYLNGLDESYFPEAWDRMVYFGNIFKEYYPEAHFRIDGSYSKEAMEIVHNSIDSWASHTINYNLDEIEGYQRMGIKDWLYGPMLYESKVNSWVGSSTILDLPLVNDRAISWSCWKYNTHSWISWGVGAGWVNGWYDPESWKDASKARAESDAEYTYKKINGSALLVYSPGVVPNVEGPCPSIRLKMLRDGVQEYEYMRLLSELDGNDKRADEIVNKIIKQPFGVKSIGNLDVWSFDPEQWDNNKSRMGAMIDGKMK